MNTNWKSLNQYSMRLAVLVLIGILVAVLAGIPAQPVQAGPSARKTRTPTPSPTPLNTPTPTPAPFLTPTPGPTTTVNGTWKIVPSPNVGTGTYGNQLNGVAAVSTNDVWAVGFSPHPNGTPQYIRQTLIERWNGNNWTVVPSPNPVGNTYVELNGVAAISANDIWAVGHGGDPGSIPLQTLTEHWNGTSWSIIPSPSPGTYNGNVLNAVDGVSANDVWAVGDNGQTQHWNGSDWSRVAAPYPGLGGRFNGVAAASANDLWAAGSYTDGGALKRC